MKRAALLPLLLVIGLQAPAQPGPGISESLAANRRARIRALRYELSFLIPAEPRAPIEGREVLRFTLKQAKHPLVLDFAPGAASVASIVSPRGPVAWRAAEGHLILPTSALRVGENRFEIAFRAGDAPLNRNPDFLYTLFVPARAHQAFPCFDQPDLKGRYRLTLELPATWQAVANGAETSRELLGDRMTVRFAETQPLPTYLFAFAVGAFQVETAERNGRTLRMFHRERDAAKLARNREAIFDLHASALAWMERYTDIPYPFGKFDFVLIPAFQFGGMEHPGAILYKEASLMLDESATAHDRLARAELISHETAHMWFGDLVTMRWFNDVWMKEVFAQFMASRIVSPSFPEVTHELRFLLDTTPGAYRVDRTAGANPIRQHLENLSGAGSLYGPIIYNKAPIVMRNLELLLGKAGLRDGLRTYLRRHAFGNAAWPDLIGLLARGGHRDLRTWSRVWVEQEGRPTVKTLLELRDGKIHRLAFSQEDPRGRGLLWNQPLRVILGGPAGERCLEVKLDRAVVEVPEAMGLPAPEYVLPNGGGLGYGQFELDPRSLSALCARLPEAPLSRGGALLTLWDAVLTGALRPQALAECFLGVLPRETDELNTQFMLDHLQRLVWDFLSPEARLALAPRVEGTLRAALEASPTPSRKSACFKTFRSLALTREGTDWLEALWRRTRTVPGLTFAERDDMVLAQELALREVPGWKGILSEQLARIQNPDRKAEFTFLLPSLDADPAPRRTFFESLKELPNRSHESWVLQGLRNLNHPLRAASALDQVRPGLEMLREIQRTGDIFFPQGWVAALLNGHTSAAAGEVKAFLAGLGPEYPMRLRMDVEVEADRLWRIQRVRREEGKP